MDEEAKSGFENYSAVYQDSFGVLLKELMEDLDYVPIIDQVVGEDVSTEKLMEHAHEIVEMATESIMAKLNDMDEFTSAALRVKNTIPPVVEYYSYLQDMDLDDYKEVVLKELSNTITANLFAGFQFFLQMQQNDDEDDILQRSREMLSALEEEDCSHVDCSCEHHEPKHPEPEDIKEINGAFDIIEGFGRHFPEYREHIGDFLHRIEDSWTIERIQKLKRTYPFDEGKEK